MKILEQEDKIVVQGIDHFNIEHILECGQCFRFYKIDEQDYVIIAFAKILRVRQFDNKIIFYNTTKEEFENIWMGYFSLKIDYGQIKKQLSDIDEPLYRAIDDKGGIRLLFQDSWETLISFIISQNKHITHIKRLIEELSKAYGDYIGKHNDVAYYSFPSVRQLSKATEEDLRKLKVGFRAPYIKDACEKVGSGEVDLESLKELSSEKAKKELLKIKGVGSKVADCVLLFGLGKYDVFPTDVWVKRVMEYYYFKEDAKIEVIHNFAKERYGRWAGYAQQYLFYYARDKKIGK